MTKVYCVIASSGSYEDYYESIDKAFFDQAKAEEYKHFKNGLLRKNQLEEEQKAKKLNEVDSDSITEEEWDDLWEQYKPNYFVFDQHDYRIDIIEVE